MFYNLITRNGFPFSLGIIFCEECVFLIGRKFHWCLTPFLSIRFLYHHYRRKKKFRKCQNILKGKKNVTKDHFKKHSEHFPRSLSVSLSLSLCVCTRVCVHNLLHLLTCTLFTAFQPTLPSNHICFHLLCWRIILKK